jgi:hypothetical protein
MALEKRYHEEWQNISRYIRELFNYHCVCCGLYCKAPSRQKDLLQVHHIDENPENNDFENLIPLCATCHLRIEKEARLHAPYRDQQSELFFRNLLDFNAKDAGRRIEKIRRRNAKPKHPDVLRRI